MSPTLTSIYYLLGKYDVHVELRTYAEAKEICKSHGRQLAEPTSAQANNELVALARTISFPPFPANWGAVWIGIRRSDGRFKYESNGQSVGYTNWFPDTGEPNDIMGVEDCACIYSLARFLWCDAVCPYKNSFICERGK